MARKSSKPVHHVQMTDGKRQIIQQLLTEYDINSAEDIQEALKDLLGGTIKEMMEAEMDDHLGYQKSERSDSDDYRNGYKSKQLRTSYGSMNIEAAAASKVSPRHITSPMPSDEDGSSRRKMKARMAAPSAVSAANSAIRKRKNIRTSMDPDQIRAKLLSGAAPPRCPCAARIIPEETQEIVSRKLLRDLGRRLLPPGLRGLLHA